MSIQRAPMGNAQLFGNNEIFVPQSGCRSIIFSNNGNTNNATVNGLVIPKDQTFTIDVYPGEVIGGQFEIKTTGGDNIQIMQFS